MEFKVKIKCELCKCKFELRPREFEDKESLSCPNCGQKLDNSVYAHLRNGIVEFSQVPDQIPKNANPFSSNPAQKPLFSFRVAEFGDTPVFFNKGEKEIARDTFSEALSSW